MAGTIKRDKYLGKESEIFSQRPNELSIQGKGAIAYSPEGSSFYNINDHPGLGDLLNKVREEEGFGPNHHYKVIPGMYNVSTPIDWTAQGGGGAIKGPSVDLRGAKIDPDVGAGNPVFDRVGVRDMDIWGGYVELVNGSGCEVVCLDARNSNGARPRLNTWFRPRFNDAGASIAAYYNVGAPRQEWVAPEFKEYNGEAMCYYGNENVDGISSFHDTIDDNPPDAAQCVFWHPQFVMHGTGGRAVCRIGGNVNHSSMGPLTYFQSNQDAIPAVDLVANQDSGGTHQQTRTIQFGRRITFENFGTGFAPAVRINSGHSANVRGLEFGNVNWDLDSSVTEGYGFYDASTNGVRKKNWRIGVIEEGPAFGDAGSGRWSYLEISNVFGVRGGTLADVNWFDATVHQGFDVPNLTITAGTTLVQGSYQDTRYYGPNGSRIEYNPANGDIEIYNDSGTQQV